MADDERRAEIEAVALNEFATWLKEWRDGIDVYDPATQSIYDTLDAVLVRVGAALDRVRDARGGDEADSPFPPFVDEWLCPTCGGRYCHGAGEDPPHERPRVQVRYSRPAARSPQDEDHEAEIPEAALDAAEQAVHACRHYALGHPSRRALYVDARDEAYDVLAAALPHLAARSPQGEDHEAGRLAKLAALAERDPYDVEAVRAYNNECKRISAQGDAIEAFKRAWDPAPLLVSDERIARAIAAYLARVSPSRDGTVAVEDALRNVERAAREVDVLFDGEGPGWWTYAGKRITDEAAMPLLSMHDYLNDVSNAMAASPASTGDHEHEWIDARNSVVTAGEICAVPGCGAIRASTSDREEKVDG